MCDSQAEALLIEASEQYKVRVQIATATFKAGLPLSLWREHAIYLLNYKEADGSVLSNAEIIDSLQSGDAVREWLADKGWHHLHSYLIEVEPTWWTEFIEAFYDEDDDGIAEEEAADRQSAVNETARMLNNMTEGSVR